MRTLLFTVPCLAALTGCTATTSYVHSDTTLGRVVVYRNGVAYFERTALVERDDLELKVSADKVDDFLKSLTVVDAKTGEPMPIAYPTSGQPDADTGLIDMKISLQGALPQTLRVSYVTEAPSWKPSYRVVLGQNGKVSLQAWAIVDNTSGEDWKNVELAVGSSSALSFRFDLRSVRTVQRETLRSDDLFAQAPPMGGASYAGGLPGQPQQRLVVELSEEALAAGKHDVTFSSAASPKKIANKPDRDIESAGEKPPPKPSPARQSVVVGKPPTVDVGTATTGVKLDGSGRKTVQPAPTTPQQPSPMVQMAQQLKNTSNTIVIEGYADGRDGDKYAASLDRANRARAQLIQNGVDPNRLLAVGNGQKEGKAAGVRIVEAPKPADGKAEEKRADAPPESKEPIGASHFESKQRMTVPRGTSAMVSILKTDTDGEVVYYFDAESARGNSSFPFRAVRIRNPTDSSLESGPVTVFGEGKFIGEGLADPIPARSVAFVPFALDRQIVVEKKEGEEDKIARILTVQRGVFSTEVQHTRRSTLILTNRLSEKATVYVRHTVAQGYKLTKGPEARERIGGAYLFRADLEPNGKAEVVIEEATPLFKSTDIRAQGGMDMVTAYLTQAAEGRLKSAVGELLKLHKEMANTEQQIETIRDQMAEYRTRMDELHAQVVTLKVVKTAGPLMTSLEKKLQDLSDRLSKATIDLVGFQEKLMVSRIRFQDGVAELSLEKTDETKPMEKAAAPAG